MIRQILTRLAQLFTLGGQRPPVKPDPPGFKTYPRQTDRCTLCGTQDASFQFSSVHGLCLNCYTDGHRLDQKEW